MLRSRHASAGRVPGAPAEPPASPGTGGAPPKSLLFAYFLWALPLLVPPVGLLGLHHVYLGRDVHAALYMISLGGFGLGWLRDGVRLSDYVRQASPSADEHGLERRRRELYPRPGGLVRLLAAGYFASNFSFVLRSVWPAPEESPLPQADAWAEVALGALGIALGVWAVGSVTPQVCSFLPTLGAATAGELIRAARRLRGVGDEDTILTWLPLLFALGAARYSARYAPPPPPPPQRRGIGGRLARLWVATGAFWLLACSSLVQHGTLTTMRPDGASETVRLRDCFKHIYNSPVWRDLPSFFSGVRTDWHESNWQETFRRATQTMDVTGEARARRTLGVPAEAEWAEVKKAHRALALQYHPDKLHPGEQPDSSRFREVQEAYDLLSTLHKRRRRPERSDEE